MVKGDVIQQRDTISRPNVNYRKLDALNCSMIKLYDSDPVLFYEIFKLGRVRENKKTTSIILGDLADFFILDCRMDEDEFNRRFDEKFALFEGNKGEGQVFVLADILFDITQKQTDPESREVKTEFASRFSEAFVKVQQQKKYKGKTEDYALTDFYAKGYDYYQALLDNIGKTVIDVSLLDKAKRVWEGLINDPFTKDVFVEGPDEEYFPKHPIEWVYSCWDGKEVKCKSEIDILKVNHHDKIIYLKDLKTTYDNENFELSYLRHGYYTQASFYYLAVKYWAEQNNLGDYTLMPMEFIVGDTSAANRRPIRFQTDLVDYSKGLDGFSLRGNKYRGVRELVSEICWAEENGIWNASKTAIENNGIFKLDIQYD